MGQSTDGPLTPPWELDESGVSAIERERAEEFDFFISYAGEDLEIARRIADELRREGHAVRFQQRDFGVGRRFQRQIDAALSQARRVIAVVSEASLSSEWCRDEWDAARDKLLPLRIEQTDVAGLQGLRTWVDLFGAGIDDEASFRAVLLEAVAGQQPARRPRPDLGPNIDLPRRRPVLNGREPLLKEIYTRLHREGAAPRRLTLTGMGGIGKTAVAIEYGHRMRERDGYSHVWFVRAEQPAALEDQLRVLVSDFQVARKDVRLTEQLRRVLERQSRWLLIVDRASDLGSIAEYLPSSEDGHVLITSENTATWGAVNVIDVPGWSRDDAIRFLLDETGSGDRGAAEALADELDCHPESLIQAASYIDRTGITILNYLARYRDQRSQAAEEGLAWMAVAIDDLESKPLAVETLRVAAFLAPDEIPLDLLLKGLVATGRRIDERGFDLEVAEPLRRFSLIRRDDRLLTVSRLVQRQLRASAVERGDSGTWIAATLAALDDLFPPTDRMTHPDVWPRAAELLPHLLAVTEHARAARVDLGLVGRLWCRAGAYLATAEYDTNNAGRASMGPRSRGASVPTADGRAALSALNLLTDARRLLEEVHGEDHLDVAEAVAQLGELWLIRGRPDEAISFVRDAYEIAVRAAGQDSLDAGLRLVQWARAERDTGSVSGATDKLERALAVAETAGAEGQLLRYNGLASQGIARTRQGRHAEAVAHLRESIRIEEELWGPNHVEVALTLDSLGSALAGYGDPAAAADAYDRKLEIERAVYGEQSRQRLYGLTVAALDAIGSGNIERARELAADVLTLVGNEPVQNDDTVSLARQVLARADRLSGGNEWRELLADAGGALVDAGLPNVEPRLLLVDCFVEDGSAREGAELAALVARERIDGGDWTGATDAILTEAVARTEAGELDNAKEALMRLVEILDQHPGTDESLLIRTRLGLGLVLLALNRGDEALECFEAAHRLAESLGYVLYQAEAALGRGQSLALQGEHAQSVEQTREALELRAANVAPRHALVVDAQLAVARAEGSMGNDAEARRLLNDAVAVTAARAGARSVDVVWIYIDVADNLMTLGRTAAAKGRLDEARHIVDQIDGDGRDVLAAKTAIGSLLLAAGDRVQARDIATSVLTTVAPDTAAGRVARARAAELDLRVAAAGNDANEARRIVNDLERELGHDPGLLPRLRADCWLVLADVVATDPAEALAAVSRAQALAPDPQYSTHDEVALREAELRWQLGRDEEALPLAEELLSRPQAASFRLDVLRVAVFTALSTARAARAAELVGEALALAERDEDPLRQTENLIWIASAQADRGEGAEARRLYELAAENLRAVVHAGQPDIVRAATELYGRLAHELSRLGDSEGAAKAVEKAIEGYRRALGDAAGDGHTDGGESSGSSFLSALMRASSLTDEGTVGSDRFTASRPDDADAWQQVLIALVDLVGDLAVDDESFDRLTRWAEGLGEQGSAASEQLALLATLAERRGYSYRGWDERAVQLLTVAEEQLVSVDEPLESLRARLALLRADGCLYDGEPSAAVATLEGAADALAGGTDAKAAAQVLMRLAALHAELDDPQEAARRFGEAKRLLDALRRPLADRLELRTTLALAHLQAKNRPAGIAELRHAAALVLDEEPPVNVGTIRAMVHLVSALMTDADDRERAEDVLDAAVAVHDGLLASGTPRTDALAELTDAVRSVRGPDAALTLVASAAQKLGDPSGAWSAMVELADAGVTAEQAFDAIWSIEDPVVRVETTRLLAEAMDFEDRADDARTLLSTALERLQVADVPSRSLELDLLIGLSDLALGEEDKVRAFLQQALELAGTDAELQGRVSEVQERLNELEPARGRQDDIDELSELAARYPDDPWVLGNLARAEFSAGRYQAALDSAGQALAVAGREPSVLVLCAQLCNGIAEYQAAADYARAAIEVDASYASAQYALAWALQHLGSSRGQECEAAFQQVLDTADDRSTRLYGLKGRAGARRILGREAEARADYEEVLGSLEPGEDPWLEGWVRYNLGNYEGATLALQQALAADDERIAARFDLALVSAVAGRPDAVEEYRAALGVVDDRPPRGRLAPLRVAQNDLRDAESVHPRLSSDSAFRAIVDEVTAKLEATESLVVRPILPTVPTDVA